MSDDNDGIGKLLGGIFIFVCFIVMQAMPWVFAAWAVHALIH